MPHSKPCQPTDRFSQRAFLGSFGIVAIIGCTVLWMAAMKAQGARSGENAENKLTLQSPRVTILKSKNQLLLFENNSLVRVYPFKLGSNPTGQKIRAGDGRTPEGVFRIVTKRIDSPNHRFLGINYPDVPAADRGLADGLISTGEALAIKNAHDRGICPSWTTALGGGIGIHGGSGSPGPTAGCVGLSDAHATELFEVLRIGDSVEILP
jgi:L,D-peptidoglycan transpeptidase YkuD (ErfK/YbiS/YcfS/YnhG family)